MIGLERQGFGVGFGRARLLVENFVGTAEPAPTFDIVGFALQPAGQASHHAADHLLLLIRR